MTREEALHIIDIAFDVPLAIRDAEENRTYHEDEIREAKRIAIKALEQEFCEEAISRQATVERLCKVAEFMNEKRNGLGSPYVMAALFIQDNKDEFPSVTPQPKMGRWLISDDMFEWAICSLCKENICEPIKYTKKHFKYCPNCGAKMQEVEDEESN